MPGTLVDPVAPPESGECLGLDVHESCDPRGAGMKRTYQLPNSRSCRQGLLSANGPLAQRSPPKGPQDLTTHNCINLRLPTHGGLYAWDLEKGRRELHVRVDGQLVFNNIALRVNAVLEGLGLAFLPENAVQPYLAQGRLKRVLEDWCPSFPGYRLYYPSRRQTSPAFGLLVDALRYGRAAA
jgi:DNA-binding transcriptional LysR family regulator